MGIFLAGAGPDPASFPEVFDLFTAAAALRSGPRRPARIAVAVHDRDGDPLRRLPEYAGPLQRRIDCSVVPILLQDGTATDPGQFDGVHGVVVGGGLTPAYLQGLVGASPAIARLAAAGVPYLGFSAGAMVAPARALIGGYRINGREVCAEECSEGLAGLEFRRGLGIVPFAVDVHAAQAGTLSRAAAAVAAGLADRVVALDEDTAIVLGSAGDEEFTVLGKGACWDIRAHTGSGRPLTGGTAQVAALVTVRTALPARN